METPLSLLRTKGERQEEWMLTFLVSNGSALNPLWEGRGGGKQTVIHTDGENEDRGQSGDAVSQRGRGRAVTKEEGRANDG